MGWQLCRSCPAFGVRRRDLRLPIPATGRTGRYPIRLAASPAQATGSGCRSRHGFRHTSMKRGSPTPLEVERP